MGYDIDICRLQKVTKKGKTFYKKGDSYDHAYMSYNFSCVSDICPKHYMNDEFLCECEKVYLFYVRKECLCNKGKCVASTADKALKFLKGLGVEPANPDITNSNWGWGTCNGVRFDNRKFLEVFAFHLKHFRDLGLKYKELYFCHDAHESTKYTLEDITSSEHENENENEIDEQHEIYENYPAITYYRHPVKGTMAIRTFKDAMEVYGIFKLHGQDEMAEKWYDLAFDAPDAPKR